MTGLFVWIKDVSRRSKKGSKAGYKNGSGYTKIRILGVQYYAHRLAFLYMTGHIPKVIDHINGVRSDNRWLNLREVTQKINCANRKGVRGVRKRYGKWYARYAGKHIGVFGSENQAIQARKQHVIKINGFDPDLI